MPLPPGAYIPATPHEESVGRLFAHRKAQTEHPVDNPPQPNQPAATPQVPAEINPADPRTLDQILLNRYIYHPPKASQIPKYERIRESILHTARIIVSSCPPCNELERALDALDAAMMFANASIARNE